MRSQIFCTGFYILRRNRFDRKQISVILVHDSRRDILQLHIWAYNLETVLAEKLETIITRTTTNTRMRDFYDIYILEQLHGTTLNPKILHDALLATAHKRGSEKYLNQAEEVFDEVENDSVMQKLWEAYRKKFSYASDLEWDVIMKAIRRLYVLCEKGISL